MTIKKPPRYLALQLRDVQDNNERDREDNGERERESTVFKRKIIYSILWFLANIFKKDFVSVNDVKPSHGMYDVQKTKMTTTVLTFIIIFTK